MVKRIILVVVFFVAFLWYQSWDTKNKSDDYAPQAVEFVRSLPEYGTNEDFFKDGLLKHHETAFKAAYTRRRFTSKVSDYIYQTVLLTLYSRDAEAAGNAELFETIQGALQQIEN